MPNITLKRDAPFRGDFEGSLFFWLLLFPAIIYFAVGLRNGHLEITYLLPNYIFMAWPNYWLQAVSYGQKHN